MFLAESGDGVPPAGRRRLVELAPSVSCLPQPRAAVAALQVSAGGEGGGGQMRRACKISAYVPSSSPSQAVAADDR